MQFTRRRWLSHHFFNEKDILWLKKFSEFNVSAEEARALIVVRELGAITNADYRNINCVDTLTASMSLRRLRDLGLLESKGKSSQTYYKLGKTIELKEIVNPQTSPLSVELTPEASSLPMELTPEISSLLMELTPQVSPLSMELTIPSDLKQALKSLGSRTSKDIINDLILRLCAINKLTLTELSNLLKRNANYVRHYFLIPLIRSGELEYTFPHQPNHPQQAYKTKHL